MPRTDPVTVEPPPHPLPALATFELSRYRRQLESAIAAAPPAQADLQARLGAVLAEQEDRARLAADA